MLQLLGKTIEKRPWLIVSVVILITLGFSIFIPSIEFKTDFDDFLPDEPLVNAFSRIQDDFGVSQIPLFMLAETEQSSNVLTPAAIREIYDVEQHLQNTPYVDGVVAFTTLLNSVCYIEFGASIENCTDTQLQIAITDLLMDPGSETIQVFSEDDPNEPIDYSQGRILTREKAIDSADIKNCYLTKNKKSITFSIEVYDLQQLNSMLHPVFNRVNVMEWYLEFENLIRPDEQLNISYRIAAHIEPANPLWEIGKGMRANFRELLRLIKNGELFNSYTSEVYLWIQPPNQTTYFPLPLETGNISIDKSNSMIHITVDQEELGQYGITPRIGSFELPAKLSEFSAGVRYYQTPFLQRPGGRIDFNVSYVAETLSSLQKRPVVGRLAGRVLKKIGGIDFEQFDELFELMKQTESLPETLALQDLDSLWKTTDIAPDTGVQDTRFYITPPLFGDLQLNTVSFLSEDYAETGKPHATLVIIQINFFEYDYNTQLELNRQIASLTNQLNEQTKTVSLRITGESIITSEINDITIEANQILGPALFIVIVVILFISFRRLSYVILPMVALLVSMIWLFGTMGLLGLPFNIIAVALIPLILGLGVDYSVHLFHNYRTELEKGRSPAEAIKYSVLEIGTAMSLAWLTTVIAFMSFLSATIPPIQHFGVLLALGVTYTFLTSVTLLAASRYLLDTKSQKKKNRHHSVISPIRQIMGRSAVIVLRHQKKMMLILISITLLFALAAAQLEFGFDMTQFVPKENESMQLFDTISDYFPFASEYQEYIFIEGDIATVATLKGIAQTHQNVKDDTYIGKKPDGSIKITSIFSVIQKAIENNESLVTRFNIDPDTGIPQTNDDVEALYDYLYEATSFSLPEEMSDMKVDIDAFMINEAQMVLYRNHSKYEATIIYYYLNPSVGFGDGNLLEGLSLLYKELRDDLANYGPATALVTGPSILQLTITQSLSESQILSTGISLILAVLLLMIVYRNPLLGIITMLPVGISIIWILGTMSYLGYILDTLTITVTSITIGIGIDYAIHATQRFRLIVDKTGDITEAIRETISHTGGALLIAGLTTSLGFGVLILAPIPPQQRFGIIIAITIIYSFLISVFFLPLFLAHWAESRKKRKGYIITQEPFDIDAMKPKDEEGKNES